MRLTEAADIARLLGVPVEDVLTHAGVQRASHNAAMMITGWMDTIGEIHFADDLGAVAHPGGELPMGATVIQCRSAGGLLDYMDGWLLFAAPPLESGSADQLGRLCLVRLHEGVVMLAQLRRGYQRGRWNLGGPAAIANDVAIDWAATVLQIKT